MTARECVDRRVKDFVEACRREGVKATHQRTEILRELVGTGEHPDAEAIYRRVRERIPAISLDTVYRTLRMMEENGVITRVGPIKDRARFDANTDPHHHFVCTRCGLIGDFRHDFVGPFKPPVEVAEVGTFDDVRVELRGVCHACRDAARPKPE